MADLSIDGPSGLPLVVGAMDAGGVYLSDPVFLPRGTVMTCTSGPLDVEVFLGVR